MVIGHSTYFRMLKWALGFNRSIQVSNAKMCIDRSTGAFSFPLLRWAWDIPPGHSDLTCSDGHLPFHRSIQISYAKMGFDHSTGAFKFFMLRWALDIPPEHSDFEWPISIWYAQCPSEHSKSECKGGMPNAHLSI